MEANTATSVGQMRYSLDTLTPLLAIATCVNQD